MPPGLIRLRTSDLHLASPQGRTDLPSPCPRLSSRSLLCPQTPPLRYRSRPGRLRLPPDGLPLLS